MKGSNGELQHGGGLVVMVMTVDAAMVGLLAVVISSGEEVNLQQQQLVAAWLGSLRLCLIGL
jgi:hypothetical protein